MDHGKLRQKSNFHLTYLCTSDLTMEANRRDGNKAWTPLFFSFVLIVGMVLGFNMRDSLKNKRDIGNALRRNDRIEEIIGLIREKYVDTINTNELYENAVTGLLTPLDPHTLYIPTEELESVNEDLEGSFSGIGIEFSILRDTLEVTSVIKNGPAYKAGMIAGDQILKVDDSLVAGNGITSDRIMKLLRGQQNSLVDLTVRKISDNKVAAVTIKRDMVPIYSVDAALMLDQKTGYIKINRFSATTYDEFVEALATLKEKGASQLIVDLRDNPGGYLDAATTICDEFIDGDKLLVYTNGRKSGKNEYYAGEKSSFEHGKIAILVDEGSASASEILAGAVQDWDRGIIVGRRTFGKGLVQEQYEMPDGSALRLTIAKYYTPSGRCIQRSYKEGKEAYRADIEKRYEDGELTGKEKTKPEDTTKYYTANRRLVYGGGGVKPDVYVAYDTNKWATVAIDAAYSEEMKTAIWDYYIRNRSKLKYNSISDFVRYFNDEKSVMSRYISSMPLANRKNAVQLFEKNSINYLNTQIKAELARYLYQDNGYYTVKLKEDNVVNKALTTLNSPIYDKLLNR